MLNAIVDRQTGSVTVVVDGRTYNIHKSHPNYQLVKEALLKNDTEAFLKVAEIPQAINEFTCGKITVKKDGDNVKVYYGSNEISNSIVTQITALISDGFPYEPLVKFLDKLLQNPSRRAVNELYSWLEKYHLPLTPDGNWLGYKRITQDWKDCHTGKIDNRMGTVVSMTRNEVDDNWGTACSQGLHVGALSYVRGFNPDGRIVLVEVNPKDVVAFETSCDKLRVCEYRVVAEFKGELDKVLYQADGSNYASQVDDDEDDEDEDTYEENQDDYEDAEDDDDIDDEDDDDDDEDDEEDDRPIGSGWPY